MANKPNRAFKRDYDKLFKSDPAAANLLLLLFELADEKGRVCSNDDELYTLFNIRFEDVRGYQL